jgi:amino acid adenylation domain-containing protein
MLTHLKLSENLIENTNGRISNSTISTILVHQYFEAQVERSPDAIAIVERDKQLTYRELNTHANRLAYYLQKLGVKSKTLVGLYLDRSIESIIALLGILKAGGVYVPLDPSDSKYRLSLILKETRISVLLTCESIDEELNDYSAKVICLDRDRETIEQQPKENLLTESMTDGLAAIFYPIGQTRPIKGVNLTHKGIIQLAAIASDNKTHVVETFIQVASLSSESALFEIWGSLLNGNKLIIFPSRSISPALLGQTVLKHQATTLCLPTRIFHRIVEEQLENLHSIRKLYVGGDWLSPTHVQKFCRLFPDSLLFNVYSATENTGLACYYVTTDSLPEYTTIPVGHMLDNAQIYVLDQNRQLSPIGVVGELHIGGDRLAQGYYNRPELTERAFTPNPFSPEKNARLYKTGDLARWRPDNTLEFVGNIDELSALQGLSIENGRIETALYQHPAVKEACVLVTQDTCGTEILVAYVALHPDQSATRDELRQFLKEKLSMRIVPSAYVFLYALPLSASGKIDRNALPIPDISKQLNEEFTAPRNEVEKQLANVWEKLLGHHSISIHDNFFALGGHSLLSVRLISEIEKTFNYRLPLASFSQISTIAEIAQLLREPTCESVSVDEPPPGLCLEDYRMLLSHSAGRAGKHIGKRGLIIETSPTVQKSSQPFIWIGDINVSKKLDLQQPIYTLPANSWQPLHSAENYISVIASLLVDELLTVKPEGPYKIGAYCFEGLVAIEMAHLLQQQGKEVDLLALVDKYGPSSSHNLYRKLDRYFCIFRSELYQLLTLPISISKKWKYIKKRLRQRNEFMLNVPQQGEELIKHQTIAMLDDAMNNYVPKPYSGKVILVKSTKTELSIGKKDLFQFDFAWLFPYFGWEGLLTGKVETYKMPCKHLEVYEYPHIKELSNLLENVLGKSDNRAFNN